MSLFTEHIYVMQSKILSDMTNNVFIRYFKILCTALLIMLLSIPGTDFCGFAIPEPYNITGKQNPVTEQTRVLNVKIYFCDKEH